MNTQKYSKSPENSHQVEKKIIFLLIFSTRRKKQTVDYEMNYFVIQK